MWIVKGSLLGTGIVLPGLIIYLCVKFQLSTAQAIGTTAIRGWTIQNPIFWTAFAVTLVAGWSRRWN
jgi:hypothetical protein